MADIKDTYTAPAENEPACGFDVFRWESARRGMALWTLLNHQERLRSGCGARVDQGAMQLQLPTGKSGPGPI